MQGSAPILLWEMEDTDRPELVPNNFTSSRFGSALSGSPSMIANVPLVSSKKVITRKESSKIIDVRKLRKNISHRNLERQQPRGKIMDISKLVDINKSRKTEGWMSMEGTVMRDMVTLKDTMHDTINNNDLQITPKIKQNSSLEKTRNLFNQPPQNTQSTPNPQIPKLPPPMKSSSFCCPQQPAEKKKIPIPKHLPNLRNLMVEKRDILIVTPHKFTQRLGVFNF